MSMHASPAQIGKTQSPVKHSASNLLDESSATVQTRTGRKNLVAMGPAQPALTAALLLAAVRGFAVLRHSPRRSVVQRPPQRPSLAGQPTRVAAGAIDLAANATKGLVEGVVRTVTDNDEYQFGDLTKGVVRDLTGKDASEYQFGDITKKAVTNFTGKEDYEFGDISRKVLSDAESSLEALRDAYFRDLPNELQRLILGGLPKEQREALISAITSYGSMAVLVWSLVSTTCTAGLVFTAWTRACLRAAPDRWASAIGTIPTLRLLEPALLPVKALLFVLSINRYQRTALGLQRRLPQRWYPQFVSVIAVFLAGTASVALATGACMLGVGAVL